MQLSAIRCDLWPKNAGQQDVTAGQFFKFGMEDLDGDLKPNINKIMLEICDPLTQVCSFALAPLRPVQLKTIIEITWRPGVTDNSAAALKEVLLLKGIKCQVQSGTIYLLNQAMSDAEALSWATGHGANLLVHEVAITSAEKFWMRQDWNNGKWQSVKLSVATTDHYQHFSPAMTQQDMLQLSKERCLGLSPTELQVIWKYYQQTSVQSARRIEHLPPGPTDVELELLAQSWSEHCKHKIFQARIDYSGPEGKSNIDGLFKQFIKAPTMRIIEERRLPWAISLFRDNAGIVRFDDKLDICLKVETHNSPSALDPYGGAITGILGVNRDILGTGMGAKPIANLDVFCLPDESWQQHGDSYPLRVVEPIAMLTGVHRGVQDGGNKSGIATVNGSMFFAPSFAAKPLIFVGTLGVLPHEVQHKPSAIKAARAGDLVVIAGGAVGADGIHGATFSSMVLDESSPLSAVQIGDPLTQKRLLDFILEARDLGLYNSITDNGAGGISSSAGEMAQQCGGVLLQLDKNHLKYPNLRPWEILISESQERMTLAVDPKNYSALLALAKNHGVDVYEIGQFTNSGLMKINYQNKTVALLPLEFIHEGNPQLQLVANWNTQDAGQVICPTLPKVIKEKYDWNERGWSDVFTRLLNRANIASKQSWVERYDSEVQAATAIRPFEGSEQCGPSDSALMSLDIHGGKSGNGVALAHGMSTRLMAIDPKMAAAWALDEAIRSLVCSGADPECIAILDNFCWPDPLGDDGAIKLGALVRACQGLSEAAQIMGTPLISGKDSMKNDYRGPARGGAHVHYWVDPTLLITAIGRTPMQARTSMGFKSSGDEVYLLFADHQATLQASEFSVTFENNHTTSRLSLPCSSRLQDYKILHSLMRKKIIVSAHDVSEGGLWCALAESAFASDFGVELTLVQDWSESSLTQAFGEWSGAIVLSVSSHNAKELEKHFSPKRLQRIATVTQDKKWFMHDVFGIKYALPMQELKNAWHRNQWP